MKVEKLALEETGSFARIFLDYLAGSQKLAPTHAFDPSITGFEKALSYRKLSEDSRNTLVQVLTDQYENLSKTELVEKNIELLNSENTFTVTTGHQLNIFTGPLFFIFKIVSTINICAELAKKFPEYNFVPVYWMASEDHDIAEIDHTYVDGEKYHWKTDQKGAVGRFSTDGLSELADQIPGPIDVFKNAYAKAKNLAEAVRIYVNDLFGDTGLLAVDADHPALKKEFSSYIKDDLCNQSAFAKVNSRSTYLAENNYKAQLNAREINLFYLEDGLRSRIELDKNIYKVVDTDLEFSEEEILNLVDSNPEKFSPNVVLRPLYQEVILPNLGYVGGPAELAYWLQYKEMFDFYKVDFPVLMPRTFGLYLNKNYQGKQAKLGLSYSDLFKDENVLKKMYVHEANDKLDLAKERKQVEKAYSSLKSLADDIDVTLKEHIEAQLSKQQKCLDNIQTKFIKAEKRNRDEEMQMISALKEYVFPGGTLQERKLNFLSINSKQFIQEVMDNTDPFDLRLHIFLES